MATPAKGVSLEDYIALWQNPKPRLKDRAETYLREHGYIAFWVGSGGWEQFKHQASITATALPPWNGLPRDGDSDERVNDPKTNTGNRPAPPSMLDRELRSALYLMTRALHWPISPDLLVKIKKQLLERPNGNRMWAVKCLTTFWRNRMVDIKHPQPSLMDLLKSAETGGLSSNLVPGFDSCCELYPEFASIVAKINRHQDDA